MSDRAVLFVSIPKPIRVKLSRVEYSLLRARVIGIDGRCKNPYCNDPYFALQCHHVHPRSRGRLDVVGNLITVCADCHEAIERHELRVRWAEPIAEIGGVSIAGETPETREAIFEVHRSAA